MTIKILTSTIDRSKLGAMCDNDQETIKYLENLQRDVSNLGTASDSATDAAAAAQSTANTANTNASAAQVTATTAANLANVIATDYVSKTASPSGLQSVASLLQAKSFFVDAVKVVGSRVTGWTIGTGQLNLGAFDAGTTYAASATYQQSEIAAIATGLVEARQRIRALESSLLAHGLIGT